MFEIALPILFHRQPPSKLDSYESRIFLTGDPKNQASEKVLLKSYPRELLVLLLKMAHFAQF
ncbi:hypothetical protein [Novosphingobium sp. Rr 2-17]|uniref:hypothetical protein n=1 Tax=Novosphingobium sp. Rr 2-17 TaxID=555793 RepID=UPI0002F8E06D|nr:hypothetical protein [Novosphingobium sp. Rr 2-17]